MEQQPEDMNPLQKWQDDHGYSDVEAAAKCDMPATRYVQLRDSGMVTDIAEKNKFIKGTDIPRIVGELYAWAKRRQLARRKPSVMPPVDEHRNDDGQKPR